LRYLHPVLVFVAFVAIGWDDPVGQVSLLLSMQIADKVHWFFLNKYILWYQTYLVTFSLSWVDQSSTSSFTRMIRNGERKSNCLIIIFFIIIFITILLLICLVLSDLVEHFFKDKLFCCLRWTIDIEYIIRLSCALNMQDILFLFFIKSALILGILHLRLLVSPQYTLDHSYIIPEFSSILLFELIHFASSLLFLLFLQAVDPIKILIWYQNFDVSNRLLLLFLEVFINRCL
jgi:hypothetical protein